MLETNPAYSEKGQCFSFTAPNSNFYMKEIDSGCKSTR